MKALIVDDDPTTRRILWSVLDRLGYEPVAAVDGADGLAAACKQRIRLIITDWMMPKLSGIELVRRLRELGDGHLFYVILLTVKDQKSELIEAMNAGADDFIRKPFDPDELSVRIRSGQRIIDLTQRLEQQAMTDPLTGLLNRRGLHDAFGVRAPERNCRSGRGLGFIVADLDHFKHLNDSYGHGAGDLVLQQTAVLLRTLFEPKGIVARMGGEEFWVLLCDCSPSDVAERAEAARRLIEMEPFRLGEHAPEEDDIVHLTASFGYTHCRSLGAYRLENLFQVADGALYQAKQAGRNRAVAVLNPACEAPPAVSAAMGAGD